MHRTTDKNQCSNPGGCNAEIYTDTTTTTTTCQQESTSNRAPQTPSKLVDLGEPMLASTAKIARIDGEEPTVEVPRNEVNAVCIR